jgi:hypothetical protein
LAAKRRKKNWGFVSFDSAVRVCPTFLRLLRFFSAIPELLLDRAAKKARNHK